MFVTEYGKFTVHDVTAGGQTETNIGTAVFETTH